MFKFMKSKKGFTLVELMIVVVIMAILVAVAVPIFSAVTANARKKTCIGNQRNIVSQINNQVMSGGIELKVAKGSSAIITITTNGDGDAIASIADNGVFVESDDGGDKFKTLFSEDSQPFCPVAGGIIEVTVTNNGDNSCAVKTVCKTAGNLDHTLGA